MLNAQKTALVFNLLKKPTFTSKDQTAQTLKIATYGVNRCICETNIPHDPEKKKKKTVYIVICISSIFVSITITLRIRAVYNYIKIRRVRFKIITMILEHTLS